VHLAEHEQTTEGLSTSRTPTSAAAATGATMTVALRPANSTIATKTLRYSYSGGADATALTLTSTNVIVDRTISLPGGVVVSGVSASVATWAYPNIHGDVTYTINHTGTVGGPFLYDPYGQVLTSAPNTSPGDFDNGWLGQHQRPTEQQPELKTTIEMGARPYRPDLGRFLRIDPIDGGATFSDYAYVNDPINTLDLSGKCVFVIDPCSLVWEGVLGAILTFSAIVVGTLLLIEAVKEYAKKNDISVEIHHIVAQGDSRAFSARAILSAVGIGINDPMNLVPLPRSIHKPLHTTAYYDAVNRLLEAAFLKGKDIADKRARVSKALLKINSGLFTLGWGRLF